ncbi:MAG TPA: hypothetical protein VNA20_16350 [Frankiaceae bacterium]|nr:hypothetical protein [Frankiaceae bacterium]
MAAEQRALEEVVVLAPLVAGVVVRAANLLHAVEEIAGDRGGMRARVPLALVLDLTEVVTAGEDAADERAGDRNFGLAAPRLTREAALDERHPEPVVRPLAGGVLLEGPPDVADALLIHDDDADVLASDVSADVAIADLSARRRSSLFQFHSDAAGHALSPVVVVELGFGGEDGPHELSGWRFVERLRAGDELDAELTELHIQNSRIFGASG